MVINMANPSKEEQIGIHKGSLSALAKEREGLMAIVSIVEQQMQAHVKALKDLGVDLMKIAEETKKASKETKTKPIEDLMR